MDVSLTQLKVFLTVARTCNFTRAANELHMSQPAVSAHIHNLERTTRIKLFDQIGRRTYITESGREILRYAEKMTGLSQELEGVMDDLRENPIGKLRIAATSLLAVYWLPPILGAFRGKFGNVRVLLKVREVDEIASGLLYNSFDFGLLSDVERPDLQCQDLEVSEFLSGDSVLITAHDHPWSNRSHVTIDELAGEPFVLYPQDSDPRRIVDEELSRHGVELNVVVETNTTELIKRAVECGLGVSIVPRYAVSGPAANANRLSVLEMQGLGLYHSVYVVTHRSKYQTATIRAFREFLLSAARETYQKSPLPSAALTQ